MAQYELNLRDYFRVFKRRKSIIVLCAILFTLLGWHYGSRQVPLYETSTAVKVEERKTIAGLLTEWIAYSPGDNMQTQTKIITGFAIMKKVALRLELIGDNSPEDVVHKVVTSLRSRVRSTQDGNTNIIRITVVSRKPDDAVTLANAVAQVYIEENLLEKNKQVRTVRTFIENQLSAVVKRLRESEEKLRLFEDTVEDIKIAESVQGRLLDAEFRLASLLQKYTEKHPRVIQTKKQIADLKRETKSFSGEQLQYAQLTRELDINRKLYGMLKEKLEQARINEAEKIGAVSIIDPAVTPTSPVNPQTNMGVLLGGLMGIILGSILAFLSETLDTSLGTIEDVENATGLPVLGVVPSIEHEFERKGLFSGVFGSKKKDADQEHYIRLICHHKPSSPAAESFRNIRTNLRLNSSRKVILITSAHPQEGKTVTLINVGLIAAQGGLKTLLVSSDLRRPAIAKTFGLKRDPGLTEVLSGAATLNDGLRNVTDIMLGDMGFNDVIKNSLIGNLWILPSGPPPTNPAELLVSQKMTSLAKKLREDFDVVFFDSPPILPVTDASILAAFADAIVLCYEFGRTSRDALMRAKSQLDSLNANVAGIVLNHIKSQMESIEPYPYYRYRYKRYGYYTREEPKQKTKSR
ncbi:GumC family protein [Candidatus Omnitrophota bacterium]